MRQCRPCSAASTNTAKHGRSGLSLWAAEKVHRNAPGCAAEGVFSNEKRAFFAESSFFVGVPVCAGSSTWARTRDLRINSPALYQLSYRGMKGVRVNRLGTKKANFLQRRLEFLAPRPGLEPGTYGLTVRRSTN